MQSVDHFGLYFVHWAGGLGGGCFEVLAEVDGCHGFYFVGTGAVVLDEFLELVETAVVQDELEGPELALVVENVEEVDVALLGHVLVDEQVHEKHLFIDFAVDQPLLEHDQVVAIFHARVLLVA